MNSESVLVIIPTLNEKESIIGLLEKIKNLKLADATLLVVDDNSPDGTADIVRRYAQNNREVKLLVREGPKGLGPAYLDGFRFALAGTYNRIIMMDADHSHDPEMISELLDKSARFDMVIGSRYLKGVNVINWQLSRLIISVLANKYTRLITGLPLFDCTSGFKCLRRSILEQIPLEKVTSNGYSFQIELHFRAWKRGFKLKEIPIVFYERERGQSKMSRRIILEAIFKVLTLRILGWLKRY
jgi:dolichol-phosphate mannosyltransferase